MNLEYFFECEEFDFEYLVGESFTVSCSPHCEPFGEEME